MRSFMVVWWLLQRAEHRPPHVATVAEGLCLLGLFEWRSASPVLRFLKADTHATRCRGGVVQIETLRFPPSMK